MIKSIKERVEIKQKPKDIMKEILTDLKKDQIRH